LFPSKSAVRLTSRKGRLAESDIDFISSHLYAVSTEWIGFLDSVLNQDDSSSSPSGSSLESQCSAALQMLGLMGLDSDSDPTKLASKVFESLNSSVDTSRIDYIQLTHICAQLNCSVPKNFTYFVRSGLAKNIKEGLCSVHQGAMQGCLPSDRYETTCISADYHASIDTSFLDKWNAWINSPKSGLRQLIPLTTKEFNTNWYKVFLKHVSERYNLDILAENLPYSHQQFYNTQWYTVTDYDLDDSILAYWQENGTYASNMRRLVHEMLTYSCEEWIEYPFAKLLQTTTSGNKEIEIFHASIPASWLTRLRSFECVPDTQGNFCRPQELLRMSPETEALSGIERFIENKYDTEKNHAILDVLGVSGDTPGPLMLLSLLETLSRLEKIAYSETSRLYRQLDQVFRDSADDDKALIANAFADKPLLLTEQGNWTRIQDVFISNDGLDLDGLQTVLNDLKDLSLWRQLSVRERPNDEAAVAYIQALPLAQDLGSRSLELIASFLRRYGEVILSRCSAWLSLESQLLNVHSFRFAALSHSLSTDSLFVSVKQDTADLRFLDKSVANSVSNSLGLPRLEELLLFRTVDDHPDLRSEGVPSWLMSFGQCLQRVRYSDPDCQEKTRLMGVELSTTEIFYLDDIRIIPYIEGVPVGPQVICEIALVETRLYTNKMPPPRLAKLIVNEISSKLPASELASALAYCVDRRSVDIIDYFEANFDLQSVGVLKSKVGSKKSASHDASTEAGEHSGSISLSDSLLSQTDFQAGSNVAEVIEFEASGLGSSLTTALNNQDLEGQRLAGMLNEPSVSDLPSSQGNDHSATKQDVVRCFALSLGMHQISDGIFQAEQGIKLLRQRGELFPWVLFDPDGMETQRFFVLGSPARTSPFVLGSDLYGLLQSQASAYSLLAPHPETSFEVITGNMLNEMVRDELVAIFPASYRLVLGG
jgi:hypothetical protein